MLDKEREGEVGGIGGQEGKSKVGGRRRWAEEDVRGKRRMRIGGVQQPSC